ncbi:MAG: cytochrome c1 [Candidatus Sulfotelmatobacter sp.]|jgi:cytochrome c-type biogenesis protein CcmH/NrfF
MSLSRLLLLPALACCALATDSATLERGRQAEQKACTPCHSLRLVDSQRLSAAAWKKEIAKMVGWGTVVPDQQVLLDYLSAEYGDTKPVPEPARSQAGQGSAHSAANRK